MNRTGLSYFFNKESSKLVNFVRSRLKDSTDFDAEDLVQDVMISLLERRDPLEWIENLSAFVYQALRNRVSDRQRSRAKNSIEKIAVESSAKDERTDLYKDAVRTHLAEDLQTSLKVLTKKEREVFLAIEVEGKSFAQLAGEKKVPIGTLLSLKSRAAAKLRVELSHWNPKNLHTAAI